MIMSVKAVSALKAGMPAVLKSIKESRHPVLVVSKGQPQAVLQDVESYQETQDALALLKLLLHAEKSVAAKRGLSTAAVRTRLLARVTARTAAR